MLFTLNQPIYLQIAEQLCEKILLREIVEGEKLPSVRELGKTLGVNPNTVMRAFDHVRDQGILLNKRGIGYYLSEKGYDLVRETGKKNFLEKELPRIQKKARLLGLTQEEISTEQDPAIQTSLTVIAIRY